MKKIIILFSFFLFFSGCASPGSSVVKMSRVCLGTVVEITVPVKNLQRKDIENTIKKVFIEIERIENLVSRFRPESDISRINAHGQEQPIKVSSETIKLLEKSIIFSRLTQGGFDITILPLMQLWGPGEEKRGFKPSDIQLKEALNKVGYKHIKINKEDNSVFLKQEGMSLDLGGIAKGYAVDRAAAVLKREGIKNALVNAGGDIFALGKHSENKKWEIGLQHPRRDLLLTVLKVQNKAVATSGDYQKYFVIDNQRYSHIINPKTGYPCGRSPCSVTVLAADCITADALATSIFVLGSRKGIDLVNSLKNTEALVVTFKQKRLNIFLSEGLKGKVRI